MPETITSFDHYRVLRREDGSLWELGRGGMAVTFKAEDVNLGIPVALKMLEPLRTVGTSGGRERFVYEARAAARLRHQNVASIFHFGGDGERFFYAMEFVDGETLAALVQRSGPLSCIAALRIALQISKALAAAAREEIVHRDIKPANIMLTFRHDDDDGPAVKVVDFGVAGASGVESGTEEGAGFTGTAQYASPEQIQEQPVDIRSDIYSLGCTLWFMLTGHPPFRGSLASVFAQQTRNAPPSREIAHLPAAARHLVGRLLSKAPEDRPQTAVQLRREIEQTLRRVERHQALRARGGRWLAAGIPLFALLVWGALLIHSSHFSTARRSANPAVPLISSSLAEAPVAKSAEDQVPPPSLWDSGFAFTFNHATGDLSLSPNSSIGVPEQTKAVPPLTTTFSGNRDLRPPVAYEAVAKKRKPHRSLDSRHQSHASDVFSQMHRKLDSWLARIL